MIRVHNVHERRFNATRERVAPLLDGLASSSDCLWPSSQWPPIRFDRPLQVGAIGGHGPIRYHVETYEPGSTVRFRLDAPPGFDGFHTFEIVPAAGNGTTLRHTLEMNARGPAIITWPLVFGPLHDALVEDSFDRAARELGEPYRLRTWWPWVRFLRAAFRLWRRFFIDCRPSR